MATITRDDENLVKKDEIIFPNTDMIDTEPFYKNFLRYSNQQKQLNTLSPTINGYIFNLIQIVEDIGYNPKSPFIHSSQDNNKNDALFNLILKLGGAYGPLVNKRRSNINKQYFQRWYLDKHRRSASMIQCNLSLKKTTQISGDFQSNINLRPPIITKLPYKQMEEKRFQNEVLRMYGFDDVDTNSTIASSRRSSIDEKNSTPKQSTTPIELETINNFKPKQQVTIREYYPSKDISSLMVNRSLSSSEQTISDTDYDQFIQNQSEETVNDIDYEQLIRNQPQQTINNIDYEQFIRNQPQQTVNDVDYEQYIRNQSQQTINDVDYEQFIRNHPEIYNDPNPEIITKPNPDQITYKQNVSVRYLVPPTPPPPGPLIIREIVPPRPPSPPPLIIKQQEPSPPTPPPLILREAPPVPPPHQEAKVITKILPQEPPPAQRVIIERNPGLPPKPQSIIIEKWLPYKPPPPREVIYERITETPLVTEFQPGGITTDRQHHHSAEFQSNSSTRLPIPVHIEQQNSFDHLNTKHSSRFDQFAWSTQQHLERMQTHHQQWIANQHQQHMNMLRQIPSQLTTPTLIINHPPVTRTATSYIKREEVQQETLYQPTIIYPAYI